MNQTGGDSLRNPPRPGEPKTVGCSSLPTPQSGRFIAAPEGALLGHAFLGCFHFCGTLGCQTFDTSGGVYVSTRLLRYELDEVGVSLLRSLRSHLKAGHVNARTSSSSRWDMVGSRHIMPCFIMFHRVWFVLVTLSADEARNSYVNKSV